MDLISKDNLVIIKRCCFYVVVVNLKVLEMVGIGKNY